jgi:diguanylate cyclase
VRQARWWAWWLAGGAVAIVGYFLLPTGSTVASHLYEGIGLISGLAILAGVRLHRPARPAMWYWFSVGQLMSVFGDFVYDFYADVLHRSPYPSIADIFYLGSYPATLAGLILLARRRTLADLLNAAIVATGLGLAFWIFVLHPIAAQSAASPLERLVSITYPTVDLLLLAALAGQFTAPGGRTPSTRMLGAATALVLAADVTFSVMTLYSGSDGHPADAGFLLSYVFWAAAALHPSMSRNESRPVTSIGRLSRLIAFGACSLLSPALLLLPRVSRSPEDRTVVTIGAIVLFVLVLTRMYGVMTEVRRMALHDELTGLANRRSLERAAPARLILLGLNGFKNVNDELGRPIGDHVLKALAGRLRETAPGRLVARIGGDEFVVVPGPSDDDDALAERLGRTIRRPVTVGGHELLVGVSVGVAAGDDVLRRAEVAMHAAKQTGERRPRPARRRDADRARPGPVPPGLPADRAPARGQRARRRGPRALGAPDPRGGQPGPVRPGRRAERSDRRARRLDPAHRLRPDGRLATGAG